MNLVRRTKTQHQSKCFGVVVFSSAGQDSKRASDKVRMNDYSFCTEAAGEKVWETFARGCSSLEQNLYRIRRIRVTRQNQSPLDFDFVDVKVTESCPAHT